MHSAYPGWDIYMREPRVIPLPTRRVFVPSFAFQRPPIYRIAGGAQTVYGGAPRVGGLLSGAKCSECKNDRDCGLGLLCDSATSTCLPRKGECGLTRTCYGRDKCPCKGNPFTTCSCTGEEDRNCPSKSGGRPTIPRRPHYQRRLTK
jgi:hypothetical protein